MGLSLAWLFLLYLFLKLFWSHPGFATGSNSLVQLTFDIVVPLPSNTSYVFKRFEILIKEIFWELAHVSAIFELGRSDLVDVSEVSALVQDLVDLVLNLGFQIQILK